MKMTHVDSSSLEAVGYDADAQELQILFKTSQHRYVYRGVPPEVFARLMAAESKGAFVNAEIKDVYPFEKA